MLSEGWLSGVRCCRPSTRVHSPRSNWKYSQDVDNFMDGRTPISQNLNGTTMSCLNYAKISSMEGTREAQAERCSQMTHRASRRIHLAKEEAKRFGISQAGHRVLRSLEAAFPGCGASQGLSWFEICPGDEKILMVGARQGKTETYMFLLMCS